MQFLSTPSARRATFFADGQRVCAVISIHALREEGDAACTGVKASFLTFLSTPSARRATWLDDQRQRLFPISIHALREEGDFQPSFSPPSSGDFYPRPPRGGRHKLFIHTAVILNFYPRPLRGGRPPYNGNMFTKSFISIHALCEEGDGKSNGN